MKKIQKIDFYGFDQKNSSRFLLKKTRASFPFSKDVLCGNKESTTFTFFFFFFYYLLKFHFFLVHLCLGMDEGWVCKKEVKVASPYSTLCYFPGVEKKKKRTVLKSGESLGSVFSPQ